MIAVGAPGGGCDANVGKEDRRSEILWRSVEGQTFIAFAERIAVILACVPIVVSVQLFLSGAVPGIAHVCRTDLRSGDVQP